MKALLPLTLVLVASGCGRPSAAPPICTSDAQCDSGQLCFAEGCGDPGKGIVVEVEGGALNGQFAHDFAVEAGKLSAVADFPIGPPLSISGEFQRERSASSNPLDRTSYTEAVVLRAVGESTLLPGSTGSGGSSVRSTFLISWPVSAGAPSTAGKTKVTAGSTLDETSTVFTTGGTVRSPAIAVITKFPAPTFISNEPRSGLRKRSS